MHKSYLILVSLLFSQFVFAQSKSQSNWQQEVNYTIDVTLDDVNHFINASIAIEYINNSPNELSEIYMHLWPNAYKNNNTAFGKQMSENGELDFLYSKPQERGYIDSLFFRADGAKLAVEKTDDIDVVKLVLNKPLASGARTTIKTPFRVKIPKVFSRLGRQNQDYFMTQWYPKPAVYDVNGWNPMPYLNLGEFYSEFGSFKVNVTLPENYTIVATGECQTEGELETDKEGTKDSIPASSNTLKTVSFTAENVHDFAWFASKRFGFVSKEIDLDGDVVVARIVASNPKERFLDAVETAIIGYSKYVGKYPYSHATVVHGELKAGGGMEYPMITLCDIMNEEVIVHEVGHNWFYGILGNNERVYPWMDESINSFYEQLSINGEEAKAKPLSSGGLMQALAKDNLINGSYQPINIKSEDYTTINYGVSVYGIGAKSFMYLRAYLGNDVFDNCMQEYFNTWKFKHPLPDDMKSSFETTSGQDLAWFFNDLLSADSKLDYAIKKNGGKTYLVNKGKVVAPMPVGFINDDKPDVYWYKAPVGGKTEITLPAADVKPDNILLDPKSQTLDLFENNNSLKNKFNVVPLLLTGFDKVGKKKLYVTPGLGWNAFDKWMLGLYLSNHSIANKPFNFYAVPMYSFSQNSLNGHGEVSYTISQKGKGQFTDIGAKVMSYNFEERGLTRDPYKFLKISPFVEFNLAKENLRTSPTQKLKLQFDQIMLNPTFYFNDDTLSGPETYRSNSRSFATATYKLENFRPINGYGLELMAEFGQISNKVVLGDLNNKQIRYTRFESANNSTDTIYYFPNIGERTDANNFARISAVFQYNLDIGIKNKPLEMRFYGTTLLKEYGNTTYKNSVGSVDGAGYYDYRFDDFLMHRNADYGMFRNQISNRRDFSKFVGPIAQSDQWLLSANFTVPLPGKLPIKPYVEFLTFNDISSVSYNTGEVGFFYNVGLEFEVIPNRFEIFLNLAQSKEVTDYQETSSAGIDKLAERITFVLDLNELAIPKLKKQLKLF